jgi:hypothetical protein
MTTRNVESYERRLNEAAERAGPEKGTLAKVLAGELRAEHRIAIRERDAAAAVLHRQHGWTFTRLCIAINGRPNKVAAVRAGVEAVTEPLPTLSAEEAEAALTAAQADVAKLWELYKRAKEIGQAAGGLPETVEEAAAELQLPEDPKDRALAASEQLAAVTAEYHQTVADRNRGAAALIEHADWSKRNAAQLAGAYVGHLYDYIGHTDKAEADPDRVAELAGKTRSLEAQKKALTSARDTAIREMSRSMGPSEIARELSMLDERIVQIRGAAKA